MTFRGNHPDELISASLTGDLTDAERTALDAHLAHCERCRATLAAFKSERRIVSGLPVADPPRDLSARVRSGIESGRFGVPWWRRPGSQVPLLASAAVFAAAILSVVYFGHLLPAPVGQASGSPVASVSSAPSASAVSSTAPSAAPSSPATFLAPGQLGYLELSGASLQPSKLSFINDATGAPINLGTVPGPPLAAALSPDGQWLAYITRKGETGANEVWAAHLSDRTVTGLGCSLAAPFTTRLTWSPDSAYLAFTLASVDLGASSGCLTSTKGIDAWLFETATRQRSNFSQRGNAYAADFARGNSDNPSAPETNPILWVSIASDTDPASGAFGVRANIDGPGLSNVFLPLFSPDGRSVIYWSGTMAESGGIWQFSRGGMPQVSGDLGGPWGIGRSLFSDVVPVGGEAFTSGDFAWGPDSNHFAFWNGAWTGAPQNADGTYPNERNGYGGRVDRGLLTAQSWLLANLGDGQRVIDVVYQSTGAVAVTVEFPSAGIGDPPSAQIIVIGEEGSGGAPRVIGGGVNPPPWDGPAVFGH